MISDLKKRKQAIVLRKKGMTYSEISNAIKVSKGTLSPWLRDVWLNEDAQIIIKSKIAARQEKSSDTLRKKRLARNDFAIAEALKLMEKINPTTEILLLLLSLIYWCEGSKTVSEGVSFTNSDPHLLEFFVRNFEKVFKVNRNTFRVTMHLHDYHEEEKQLSFWSKTLKIPRSQFNKSYLKKNTGKFSKKDYQGCIRVRCGRSKSARTLIATAQIFLKRGL